MMGLTPTPEFRKEHTYKTLTYFPDLKENRSAVSSIVLPQSVENTGFDDDTAASNALRQKHIPRVKMYTSYRKLNLLKKSSYDQFQEVKNVHHELILKRKQNNAELELLTATVKPKAKVKETDPLTIAKNKLSKLSISHDPFSVNNHLKAFVGVDLTEKQLRMLLRRCLNVYLSKVEMSALFKSMDEDDSKLIDGVEFVKYFIELGNEERHKLRKHLYERLEKEQILLAEKKVRERQQLKEWQDSQVTAFGPEDLQSANEKLAKVALQWDTSSFLSQNTQRTFEGFLSPYEFLCQLEGSLNCKFTGAEVFNNIILHRNA